MVLADKLGSEKLKNLFKSYDIVGDIAIVRIPKTLETYSKCIAEAIMDTHKEVKSVWRQTGSVSGDYRLRTLKLILGENRTETCYKEHGCVYRTDLRKTYFSPRLSYERLRLSKLTQKGEVVLNMFAGVGCYSISIAKHSEPMKVISIDLNSDAVHFLRENIRLNKAEKLVSVIHGDAKAIIKEELRNVADRVLMPLPERAYDYLDYAISALNPMGGWIHYYDFEHAKKNEDPIQKTETKISKKISKLCTDFHIGFRRIVRPIGPRWYQVVLDIHVTK